MNGLVDFQTAIQHLRNPHQDNYQDIVAKLDQAHAFVMRWMKLDDIPADWIVADSSPEVLDLSNLAVQNARTLTLLVLSELYENREASVSDVLPDTLKRWAFDLRDPTVA